MVRPTSNELSQGAALTDEDIEQLLHQAEIRLRSSQLSSFKGPSHSSNADGATASRTLIPQIPTQENFHSYIHQKNHIASIDSSRLVNSLQKRLSDRPWPIGSTPNVKEEKYDAGSDWFNLPKTNLTPEFKRDLRLLCMRPVLDPKRHYKKEDSMTNPPKFSHVGTVIEGSIEVFKSRIMKDRKRTLVEETMALERESGQFKAGYNAIQLAKTSGQKFYYKNLHMKRWRRGT